MTIDNKIAQVTLDHFSTVILNCLKMDRPWSLKDIADICTYVTNSRIDETLKKVVLQEAMKAADSAIED